MKQTFKYFLDPENYSYLLSGEHECEICHQTKPCFDGSVYFGEEDYTAFCFDCVAEGRLGEVDAFAVELDVEGLQNQLKAKNLSTPEIKKIINAKTDELQNCTPKLPTEDLLWPTHCGELCQFIRLAGQTDFNELAPDGDGKAFFTSSLDPEIREDTEIDELWPDLKPEKISNLKEKSNPQAYLFKCLHCGTYVALWDYDSSNE